MKPLISVVMSVYNGEKYLSEAIESILNQTYTNFEFIIINDGSTDNSLEIIEKYAKLDNRIKIINRENKGLPYSLNEGILLAKGKYIARMDADDISLPNRFYEQKKFLEKNEGIIAVGSSAQIIDKDGNYIYTRRQEKDPFVIKNKILPYDTPFIHPSVMMKKDALMKTNLYPLVPRAQDLFLFNELSKYGKYSNIEIPLIKYRLTPFSSSRKTKHTVNIINTILDNYLKTGKISNSLVEELKSSIKSTNKKEKEQNYYLLLTKKYLWNSFNPFEARKNIKKYLFNKFDLKGLLLFCLTFFPKNLILFIYKRYKAK